MIIDAMALACQVDLNSFGGLDVRIEDLKTILEADKDLYAQLEDSYDFKSYNGNHGLDTYDRDYVFDAFAKFIGGEYWPCNMDTGTEYHDTFTKLLQAYIKGVE